jgi:UDP-N-acetylmuramoylalanine--D-glutamate ligase
LPIPFSLIIGLGKTGLSCARYFARQDINFIIMDSRENPPELKSFQQEFPNTPLYLGEFNAQLIAEAKEIILSPGISPDDFPSEKTISDIELFGRVAKTPIIGITGTNAKGTVTTLVAEMIKNSGLTVEVGGNIGTPALDLLEQEIPDYYVLEISSFQLETTHHLKLKVGIILNLSPDHLDRHHTMENYQKAKQQIYKNAEIAIYNQEDSYTYPLYHTPKKYSFELDTLKEINLKIQGRHNKLNAEAALAIGKAINLPLEKMMETLKDFPGLSHRCEWVATQNNITWINDSKGTNIGATIAALEGIGSIIKNKIILIAGGLGKDADFNLLQESVKKYTRQVILIGKDAPLIEKALKNQTEIQLARSLKEAILIANQTALAGDSVLLSPACASFDMFQGFEDRGNQFKILVKEMLEDEHH